jgi:hypothetical protein
VTPGDISRGEISDWIWRFRNLLGERERYWVLAMLIAGARHRSPDRRAFVDRIVAELIDGTDTIQGVSA